MITTQQLINSVKYAIILLFLAGLMYFYHSYNKKYNEELLARISILESSRVHDKKILDSLFLEKRSIGDTITKQTVIINNIYSSLEKKPKYDTSIFNALNHLHDFSKIKY